MKIKIPFRSKDLWLFRQFIIVLALWGVVSYMLVPCIWKEYFKHDSKYTGADVLRITRTADNHPGDPLNMAIVGDEEELVRAMAAAGWFPADPITLRSSMRIAMDSVFRKPDEDAPVSNLYLFGRKQDMAFEQPAGNSPRQRHHVRFWLWDKQENGSPVWFGAATFDRSIGLSHTTGEVTHHIGPNIDAERDRIVTELRNCGWLQELRYVNGFQEPSGKNGGGDLWRTDGRLAIAVLGQIQN